MDLELEIRQQVVVSTAHIMQEDNPVFRLIANDKPHLVRELPFGWEVVVATEYHQREWESISAEYPVSDAALVNILKLWQAVPELYSIVLDCDGPRVDGLDAFEW